MRGVQGHPELMWEENGRSRNHWDMLWTNLTRDCDHARIAGMKTAIAGSCPPRVNGEGYGMHTRMA